MRGHFDGWYVELDKTPREKSAPVELVLQNEKISRLDEVAAPEGRANQEPIKNETRANNGPAPAERASDQEPIKNPAPAVGNAPSPLEALFSDLTSDSTRKANKARRAAAKLPEAERILYVDKNFHDLLIRLMDAGALEVNGASTLTEDNKQCL